MVQLSLHGNDIDDGDHIPGRGMESMGIASATGKNRETSTAEKVTLGGICFIICFMLALFSIAASTLGVVINRFNELEMTEVTTVYTSLGLPGYTDYSWEDVTTSAYGDQVNIWMYGPSAASAWVQDWLATQVSNEYAITINVTEVSSTAHAVGMVTSEFASSGADTSADTATGGQVDMIWINGDNFKTMKDGGYLYGPWATKVPSADNFDWTAENIAYDFGEATQGYEMPFNTAQIVLIYDSAQITYGQLPQSMTELVTFVNEPTHPLYRKFTYAQSSDYTAAAFLRMFLYEFGGGVSSYDGDFNQNYYDSQVPAALTQLLSLDSGGIYQVSGSPYYCTSLSDCNTLFTNGDIIMTMSYNPSVAGANIAAGTWASTVQSYVPRDTGSISNNNFWIIPKNADNKLAAMVVGNYIASIGAQFNRRSDSSRWIQAYDPTCDAITDELAGGWSSAFEYLENNVYYNTTPSKTFLNEPYSLNEINSAYGTALNADWVTCITNGHSGAPCDGTSVRL